MRNRLRERGIRSRRSYCGPVLTKRHRIERQRWAINKRGRRWRNVVLSDESGFNLSHADGRVRIYRRRGVNMNVTLIIVSWSITASVEVALWCGLQ